MTTEKRYIPKRISICRKCRGTGVMTTYHEDDTLQRNPKHCTCSQCGGSGRVIISGEINIKIEAYVNRRDSTKPIQTT